MPASTAVPLYAAALMQLPTGISARLTELNGCEALSLDLPELARRQPLSSIDVASEAAVIIIVEDLWHLGLVEKTIRVSSTDSSEYLVLYKMRQFYTDPQEVADPALWTVIRQKQGARALAGT